MHLKVLKEGKFALEPILRACRDFENRIQRFQKHNLSILNQLTPKKNSIRIVLDPNGVVLTAADIAEMIEKHGLYRSKLNLEFVIGGPFGPGDTIKNDADILWSLSPSTYTSDISCLICMEQIYRAYTRIHNIKYEH